MVSVGEIAANDYNLNIPRYIDSAEAEDLHDIAAHLLMPSRMLWNEKPLFLTGHRHSSLLVGI
jgi:hypothetical protein